VFKTPKELSEELAARVKKKRIALNMTQQVLADRSGVSYGSVKRFEQSGDISLSNLLRIAISLRSTDEFESLFREHQYTSIDDLIQDRLKGNKGRKRARKK
jgi:transcriptional regulator with XRE-family HTH domain